MIYDKLKDKSFLHRNIHLIDGDWFDFQIANKTFADKEIFTRYNKVKIKISDKYCIIHECVYIYHESIFIIKVYIS